MIGIEAKAKDVYVMDEENNVICSNVKNDPVNHPGHYTNGGIECKDAIRAALGDTLYADGFCRGNAMKYLWRYPLKNGKEDVEKARFYINEILEVKQ